MQTKQLLSKDVVVSLPLKELQEIAKGMGCRIEKHDDQYYCFIFTPPYAGSMDPIFEFGRRCAIKVDDIVKCDVIKGINAIDDFPNLISENADDLIQVSRKSIGKQNDVKQNASGIVKINFNDKFKEHRLNPIFNIFENLFNHVMPDKEFTHTMFIKGFAGSGKTTFIYKSIMPVIHALKGETTIFHYENTYEQFNQDFICHYIINRNEKQSVDLFIEEIRKNRIIIIDQLPEFNNEGDESILNQELDKPGNLSYLFATSNKGVEYDKERKLYFSSSIEA